MLYHPDITAFPSINIKNKRNIKIKFYILCINAKNLLKDVNLLLVLTYE